MEARIARTLEDQGLSAHAVALVVEAHRLAMGPRLEHLRQDHHPEFLHPGRTVLVLLLDTPYRDPVGLAAAALTESERRELRVGPVSVRAALGDEVADFVESVPVADERLVEALLDAPEEVRLVALAERLDHCRHAKFWSDRAEQARLLDQAERIFAPLAERTDPTLARRFSHWAGAFTRALARRA